MHIIYSQHYLKYYFLPGHPFWPERAKYFMELLDEKKFKYDLVEAQKAVDEDILLVHTKNYLKGLKETVEKGIGYLSIDTPVHKDNLEAAYYYTGGTLQAAELALEGKKVVNTLGGLHHAESDRSSGFCIFNDHAVAIKKLQKEGKIKTAAVLDLDVHAGNGTQEIFYDDPSVLKISIHQDPSSFYPGTCFEEQTGAGAGEGFNLNVILKPGTQEGEYLEKLDSVLPKIEEFKPDLLLTVLGVDTYKGDPLASIELEIETYGKIARRLKKFKNKAALFAGGYSKDVPQLWFEFVKNL